MGRLIDADVLKKDLTRFYDGEVVARKLIDEQPTVDAVPVRRGRWVYRDDDEIQYDTYWCSECGNTVTVDATRRDDIGFTIDDLRFCPHCGAKMDGKDGDDG